MDAYAPIFPVEMRTWELLREQQSPERDEAVINNFLQILVSAEQIYESSGGPTSHYVDHELFFPVLARRRNSLYGRQIVDRLIRLRGENTSKWIEEAWQKACEVSQQPDKPPTKTKLQAQAFQRVLARALDMIARWGTRSDALINPKVALHPNASRWRTGDALVKTFHFIIDESEKPNSRIANLDETEAMVNEIIKVLYDSGLYKMSENRRWRKAQ